MRLVARLAPVVLIPLLLAGCISLSSSNPTPPKSNTTVVVPNGAPATCPNGSAPPC